MRRRKQCVMVWLFDGGAVKGGIRYQAVGNRGGFLGDHRSARVDRPAGLARLATRTNWDGAGRDEGDETVDLEGSTGGSYVGCDGSR
jgi:kynurenine formamidase